MPSCACPTMVEGSGGTLGAHTIIPEACTALLQNTSLVPRRICPACIELELNAKVFPVWLGRHNRVAKWQLQALLFAIVCVCVCVCVLCVCVCVRVCVCV